MEAIVKKWGNSYGLRLTKKDLARLGLKEGDAVDVGIRPVRRKKVDLAHLPRFRSGRSDVGVRHDEYLYGRGRRP